VLPRDIYLDQDVFAEQIQAYKNVIVDSAKLLASIEGKLVENETDAILDQGSNVGDEAALRSEAEAILDLETRIAEVNCK